MMKKLSSFSLSVNLAAFFCCATAGAGIGLTPYGDLAEKVKSEPVWSRFESDDERLLFLVRVQKVAIPDGKKCSEVLDRAQAYSFGKPLFQGWEPYESKELKTITGCSGFPCKVKLNEPESLSLAGKNENDRYAHYIALVKARVEQAQKDGRRRGYDLSDDAVDAWAWLKKRIDEPSHWAPPASGDVVSRRLEFAKRGGYLEIRQVLDVRKKREGSRLHIWVQDLYTDHYFDGWAEEYDLQCASDSSLVYSQFLPVEFDLLKNTDFFSRMMRPKMRTSVRDQSEIYLKRVRSEMLGL